MNFAYRQLAASSPSRRSVKHFALPPALTNSSSGVSCGVKPCWRSDACSLRTAGVGHHCLADDDGVAGKSLGLICIDCDQFGDVGLSAERAHIDRTPAGSKSPRPAPAGRSTCRGDSNTDRPAPTGITRQPSISPICWCPRAWLRIR